MMEDISIPLKLPVVHMAQYFVDSEKVDRRGMRDGVTPVYGLMNIPSL